MKKFVFTYLLLNSLFFTNLLFAADPDSLALAPYTGPTEESIANRQEEKVNSPLGYLLIMNHRLASAVVALEESNPNDLFTNFARSFLEFIDCFSEGLVESTQRLHRLNDRTVQLRNEQRKNVFRSLMLQNEQLSLRKKLRLTVNNQKEYFQRLEVDLERDAKEFEEEMKREYSRFRTRIELLDTKIELLKKRKRYNPTSEYRNTDFLVPTIFVVCLAASIFYFQNINYFYGELEKHFQSQL